MREKIILFGGGGHCRSCIDVIRAEGRFDIAGIVEADGYSGDGSVMGYPVIGTDRDLERLVGIYRNVLITLGQIRHAGARVNLFGRLKAAGAIFPVIISPQAYVSDSALVGEGTVVMHRALVNACAVVGANCILNTGSLVEHEAVVGDHCHISTCAILNGQCRVGSRTFIGSRAVLSNNTEVAGDTLVSAGSVVLKSLERPGTYIGNPLRKIR